MKLTITDARNFDKKRDGTPITDKYGKKKYRALIKTVEKGEVILTGFVYKPLKAGEVIDADVNAEQYNGQTQYTFKMNTYGANQQAAQSTLEMISLLKTISATLTTIVEELRAQRRDKLTEDSIAAIKSPPAPVMLDTSSQSAAESEYSEMDFDPFDEKDFPEDWGSQK